MATKKIPVFDICSLSKDQNRQNEFLIERFGQYLQRHNQDLHQPHRHSFYHLVLFTKGAGYHSIDFNKFKVQRFQCYFMIPGQVHSWHFEKETDGYVINFSENFFRSFLLNPNYLDRFSFFNGTSEEAVCQLSPPIQQKAIQLFEEMIAQSGVDERERRTDMTRLLLLQFFLLVNNYTTGKVKKPVPQQKLVLLKNFRKLIDQNYRAIKLPKEYADLLYITPNHLNALCQDLLGKTAGELIRDRVLLEAKRLLTNANMSITEIAFDLDFQDNSYFNRFFKKNTGMTPDEFRKTFTAKPG